MDYKLDISASFEDDLDDILDYISYKLYNQVAAERLLNKAEQRISEISKNPFLYPVYPDEKISTKGYHYAIIGNYLMFYFIDETEKVIHIARLIYGGRDLPNQI